MIARRRREALINLAREPNPTRETGWERARGGGSGGGDGGETQGQGEGGKQKTTTVLSRRRWSAIGGQDWGQRVETVIAEVRQL